MIRVCTAQSGFTLIELVVALVLLGLIAATLTPSLKFGSRAWDAGHQHLEETARLRTVQDLLGRSLSEALPIFLVGPEGQGWIAFEGGSSSLSLVAPMPAHLALGAFHVLQFDVGKAEGGRAFVAHWDRFRDEAEDLSLGPQARRIVLVEGIAGVEFRYFGPEAAGDTPFWTDSWIQRESLPLLVSVRVLFDRKSAREWPAMVFRPVSGGSAFMRI